MYKKENQDHQCQTIWHIASQNLTEIPKSFNKFNQTFIFLNLHKKKKEKKNWQEAKNITNVTEKWVFSITIGVGTQMPAFNHGLEHVLYFFYLVLCCINSF